MNKRTTLTETLAVDFVDLLKAALGEFRGIDEALGVE
jgi:hypothetical protein